MTGRGGPVRHERAWQLTPLHLDLACELGGFDEPRYPLAVRCHGATEAERHRLRRAAAESLRAAGLLEGGRLRPGLAGALRTLARPREWFDAVWLRERDSESPGRALAAWDGGEHGVLAVQQPGADAGSAGMTSIELLPAAQLAWSVVSRQPLGRPGRRRVGTVPTGSAGRPAGHPEPDDDGYGSIMDGGGAPGTGRAEGDRVAVTELLAGPHRRAGQLAANLVGAGGRTRRSSLLRWFTDADGDCYTVHAERGRDGSAPITVAAAAPAAMVEQLVALLERLRGYPKRPEM